MKRVLLLSTSTVHGSGYLDYCAEEIVDFLGGAARTVLFVPFALKNRDGYAAKARERFRAMGFELLSIHEFVQTKAAREALERAEAVFVGGGNTFRLLAALHERSLLGAIRDRVLAGAPYLGSSAGANLACPTIMTTNDMPIVQPPSFEALGLVPFQVNPHYVDPDPSSTLMAETREQRIREYHEENPLPVVGLREGAMLRVEGTSLLLEGNAGARVFLKGADPREFSPGDRLDFLLGA
ncbi:MAG: dipeptidase PepE [Planctomycetes bacterium]|nr:dipeptidase PepE [Planctomycetota bacterium]